MIRMSCHVTMAPIKDRVEFITIITRFKGKNYRSVLKLKLYLYQRIESNSL